MIALMVLLLVFAAAAAQGAGPFRMPALMMTWAITVLFIASATLTVAAVFFDKPKPFPVLIQDLLGNHPVGDRQAGIPTSRPFEVHAYAIGDRVHVQTANEEVKKRSDSVNVGCESNVRPRCTPSRQADEDSPQFLRDGGADGSGAH
jgi:hypothetical protein